MGKRHDAALRVKPVLQKGAQSLGDEDALEVKGIYPEWEAGVEYASGAKAQHNGRLYRCLQAHTSQADWPPSTSPSLWTAIDEEHKGTYADPIPYTGNMALVAGLYYEQDGIIYYCNRDTGNPVYSPLADLVGLFVEVAENG